MSATRLYHNGPILTMDSRGSVEEALAIRDDTILAVGSLAHVETFCDASTEQIDLQGRTLLPGFIDGHSHFLMTGLLHAVQLDLSPAPMGSVRRIADIQEKIRVRAAITPPGQWILGFGYDDTALEEMRHPVAMELDAATGEHPVFLKHISGSLFSCNSRALELAGYTKDTPQPAGGLIRRDDDGHPNGVLEGHMASRGVLGHIPPYTEEEWMLGARTACAMYTARGVTTAQDGYLGVDTWKNLQLAHEKGLLTTRVQVLPGLNRMDVYTFPHRAAGTQLTEDRMLSLGAVKHMADASIQGYTGYLANPYYKVIYPFPDGDMWRGYPAESATGLIEKVTKLHRDGWQVAIHGNGDAAIQMILDAIEEAQKAYPRADARHIVMHCQTVREDQLDRMQRLGVLPSFFIVHTYYWGDRHYNLFLGPQRAERINPLRSALRRHMPFSTHTDAYITPIDPLLCVWSAVNRLTSSGRVLGADQTVPVLEALRSVTSWAAYLACEERIKGSLEPGKLADMVLLGDNPLTCNPLHIKDIPIVATLVGGRVVHGSLA